MALESLPWSHVDLVAMEGFSSAAWTRHQDIFPPPQNVDELRQKLQRAIWELETFQSAAAEELRTKDETINKLMNLVNITRKERDETINKLMNLVNITRKERDEAKEQLNALLACLQSKTPQQQAVAVNSSLTESDSLSDTQARTNRHSYVSSPVESFYHADSSNNTNAAPTGNIAASYDYGSVIIDELAKKRPLPEKGQLMQAVMNAGPLLQTLMVAGPLPTWRNPPPFQSFQPTRFSLQCPSPTIRSSPMNFANELSTFRTKRPIGTVLDSIADQGFGSKRFRNV